MNTIIPSDAVAANLKIPTGKIRLGVILRGLQMEINHPGVRLSHKAPKCSTILRREFGLSGNPDKLLIQFKQLLEAAGLQFNEAGAIS